MDKILDKVRKLLALSSDSGATEGERDNAVRMAHGLLAKHNLVMADVEAHQAVEGRELHTFDTFGMKWCRRVCRAMGTLFFCKYFISGKINGTKMRHSFVGKQANAVTAALMSEYLITSILKEARSRYQHNLSPMSRAFGFGAATRLMDRVDRMVETGGEDLAPSTALMVVSLYKTEAAANATFLASIGVELTSYGNKHAKDVNTRAYAAGKSFADGLSLSGQVAGTKNLRISDKG